MRPRKIEIDPGDNCEPKYLGPPPLTSAWGLSWSRERRFLGRSLRTVVVVLRLASSLALESGSRNGDIRVILRPISQSFSLSALTFSLRFGRLLCCTSLNWSRLSRPHQDPGTDISFLEPNSTRSGCASSCGSLPHKYIDLRWRNSKVCHLSCLEHRYSHKGANRRLHLDRR